MQHEVSRKLLFWLGKCCSGKKNQKGRETHSHQVLFQKTSDSEKNGAGNSLGGFSDMEFYAILHYVGSMGYLCKRMPGRRGLHQCSITHKKRGWSNSGPSFFINNLLKLIKNLPKLINKDII